VSVSRLVVLAGCLGVAVGSGACASGSTVAGPTPFPRAPVAEWSARTAEHAAIGSAALAVALAERGVPYRLGGDSPASGFDCSGLVRYAYERQGIELPRTVADQYDVGAHVDRDDIQAGDLVFFSTVTRGASHVGIAVDATTFVHAPDTGSVVRVEHFDTRYWRQRFKGARRITSRQSLP
jgi:cell wall-associated NlpC family hydrolase